MTERAYRRSDALEKRRKLMNAWCAFIESKATDNILVLPEFGRKAEKVGASSIFPEK